MGVIRRYNTLKELENIDVLIDEFGESKFISISDFPDSFQNHQMTLNLMFEMFLKC